MHTQRVRGIKKQMAVLALTLVLVAGQCLPAFGKTYSDLTYSHWAYGSLTEASVLGIINGFPDGTMHPAEKLTWGQYLAMLTRAFWPAEYTAAVNDGQSWDAAAYDVAVKNGLLHAADFLPVTETNLSATLCRRDAAVLLYRMMPQSSEADAIYRRYSYNTYTDPADPLAFTDWAAMTPDYQEAVSALCKWSIIRGESDTYFGGEHTLARADGTTLLMRMVTLTDYFHTGQDVTFTVHRVDETGAAVAADETVTMTVGSSFYDSIARYKNLTDSYTVHSVTQNITSTFAPLSAAEIAEDELVNDYWNGTITVEEFENSDLWLHVQGENVRKHVLLFGNAETRRYASQEEAKAHMTTITVPVWRMNSSGEKTAGTASLQINAAIADDVKALMTEIYQDPGKFPIKDIGGYSWRGDSATGEHNCGTAIDINANENYQIRNGTILVGTLWKPGENPYSIAENGRVVEIFASYGWSWGGNAWAFSADDSEGYHDYMHFSYMGG